jgi:hypothetical protein
LSSIVKWKYDDLHNVMLAEFSVDKKDQVLFSLQEILPEVWDVKTIKKEPQMKSNTFRVNFRN